MNSFELTSAIAALANAIAIKLTSDEISLLSCIFVQLGDTLATIVANEVLASGKNDSKNT